MAEFFNERHIKATRTEHRCAGCTKPIPVRDPARYYSGRYDGYFYTCYYHVECRKAEIALNKFADTFGDEWISLQDIEEPDEYDFLRKHHPLVAERMGIAPKVDA